MSFRQQPLPPARLNRCQLFGPGSRPALFAKMAASAADVINLDLEDSVAPADKDQARANIIAAINDVDWGTKTLSVRINGLDTPFWYRDVVDLLEQAGDRLDQIMIPKAGCAADIYAVDALVTAIERAKGRTKPIAFEVIIESAAGICHVEEIAAASPRLQAISLGAADFAASMGMATTGIGGTQENYYMIRDGQKYWPDPWHWAQTAIVAACRTHGLLPVDGPFGDFSDPRVRAQTLRSATWAWSANGPSIPARSRPTGVLAQRGRRHRGPRDPGRDGEGQSRRRRRHRLHGPPGRHRVDQAGRGDPAPVRPDRRLKTPAGRTSGGERPAPRGRRGPASDRGALSHDRG